VFRHSCFNYGAPLRAVVIALTLLATGCSAPRTINPGFVADRWSMTLRAFNIDPVFLPRQVHLGDVYLSAEAGKDPENDANRWKRRTTYLGRADVRQAVLDDTRSRLRLPDSSVLSPSDDVFAAPTMTTSLRPLAFPGFNISEIRESDFAAAFPVRLFRAMFGVSHTGELLMSINIPRAEYEEVPALEAWKQFAKFCGVPKQQPACAASNPVLKHLFNNLKLAGDGRDLVPKVGIVTSVYYVRQINYFYNSGRATAFGASASRPVVVAADAPADAPAATPQKDAETAPAGVPAAHPVTAAAGTDDSKKAAAAEPGAGAAAHPAPPAADPDAALRAQVTTMQKRLDELQAKTADADRYGSLRVVSATSEGTALVQTFERPVAIGYRAIWVYPLGYDPDPPTVATSR